MNNNNNQNAITETFIKKIFAHLDNTDVNKLNEFHQLFSTNQCKIIFNSVPMTDATQFLTMWQNDIVSTQHSMTALDYHIIPGTGTLVCNVNGKIRFDESGRDKAGQDAIIREGNNAPNAPNQHRRNIWGPFFGISLQLIIDDRIYKNEFHNVISMFNYTIVYKSSDSLMEIN